MDSRRSRLLAGGSARPINRGKGKGEEVEVLARREARKVRRVLFRAAFSRGARTEAPKIPLAERGGG